MEALRRDFGFEGAVLVPGDDEFDAARRVWNAMVDRSPAVVARCTSAADVSAAVRFGRERGLELGVRCGGHGVLGLAVPEGGLMVDLSPLNGVHVDADRRLARVQGGALLGDLDRAAQEVGLATTAGNVSHTGVGGLTLGGGMGWLARRFGLACDNVASFELVTADGETLRASESDNAELFWGLRGGGGNFGVVTEFEFRLHPVEPEALVAAAFYDLDDGPDVLRRWRDLLQEAPRRATPTAWFGIAEERPDLRPELHGRPLMSVGFVWVGDPEEGRRLLPALSDGGRPVAERVAEMTYLELQRAADAGQRHGLRRYWKGHYLRDLGDDAIEALVSLGGRDGDGFVAGASLQCYGGAIAEGEGAFAHRDTLVEFITDATWTDPGEDEARLAGARRYAAAVEPFASGVYVNALSDEGASGVRRAYDDETLTRLAALKARYDPDNVFHLNHNIRPSR